MKEHSFDAVIFDLDGVITKTALVHGTAWKEMFDNYLKKREEKHGEPFKEFTHAKDYLPYVDGKPRYKGVASFLESRGIDIPYGDPSDDPSEETVCGLGNRKNIVFNDILDRDGVQVYPSTVDFIHELRKEGIRIGVASSSKNCKPVLETADLLKYFETRVDGVVSAELDLNGKPEPDIFTTACDNLNVEYHRAVVVEDAVSGVQAGKKGNFGMVLGVAREDNVKELRLNGADIVVTDIEQLGGVKGVDKWFKEGVEEDNWSLRYNDYDPEKERSREALFAVGNGYSGTRGAMEETKANDVHYPGTYIAGLYNRLKSPVGDREIENEDFVNCPNWQYVTFKIENGEWFNPAEAEIIEINRTLDYRTGLLSKYMIVKDKEGRETRIESRKLSSMNNPHFSAIEYKVTPVNYSGKITLKTELDGNLINDGVERYSSLNQKHIEPLTEKSDKEGLHLVVQTVTSKIKIAQVANISFLINDMPIPCSPEYSTSKANSAAEVQCEIEEGKSFSHTKIVVMYTSKDLDDPLGQAFEESRLYSHFDEIIDKSKKRWEQIWEDIDIKIPSDRASQRLLRMHLYHLMVTASPKNASIDFGIPARGLHGEAYRGHIFWDELYVLPVYYLNLPDVARSVLMYRYRRLNQARDYAKEYNYEGAMFPWQSGSDGREETQVVHLNPVSGEWGADYSSLQRHISAAIGYNIWNYYWYTGDYTFLRNYGAEMFLEICRFWASKCELDKETGRYSIHNVMGPDEFHEKHPDSESGGYTDNAYTNIMVVWLFKRAFQIVDRLRKDNYQEVFHKIRLSEQELQKWEDVTKKMNLIVSDEGIVAQFKGYFELKELDWDDYRKRYDNIHRLDRILKAEGKSPDEYKVAKQADFLMTFYNLDVDEVTHIIKDLGYKLPKDYLKKNFEYYLQRTSHGSTLSRVVHAYLANKIGDDKMSWDLYREALESDYVDIQGGTTGEGIHAGVMGGTVMIALNTYAGLNLQSEHVRLAPKLPHSWKKMTFSIHFKENYYTFEVQESQISVELINAPKDTATVYINDKKMLLERGKTHVMQLT